MGGTGKTVLARALALDPLLRPTFRNGVLWASLADADPHHWLRHWARLLGLSPLDHEPFRECWKHIHHALRPPYLHIILDDARLAGGGSELALHTLAEVFLLQGDMAARWGSPDEAERFWWLAAQVLGFLCQFWDEYGFDEWTLEEVTERVACWRAEHGMWREAARAAAAWAALRRYLEEGIVRPLTAARVWSLQGEGEAMAEWALAELEKVDSDPAERARPFQRGLLLARRGQAADALSLLWVARKRYAADPEGGLVARYLEQVIAAVEAGRPLPLWAARGAPYEVPCGWLSYPAHTFEAWLEEWLRRAERPKQPTPEEAGEGPPEP